MDGFCPGCPTEPGGQPGAVLFPQPVPCSGRPCISPWLSPSWKEMWRNWEPVPPSSSDPGPRSAARLTWPSWRMPCRGSAPGQAGPAAGPVVPLQLPPRAPAPGPHTPCRCQSGLGAGEGLGSPGAEPGLAQRQDLSAATPFPGPQGPRVTQRRAHLRSAGSVGARVGGGRCRRTMVSAVRCENGSGPPRGQKASAWEDDTP